MERWIVIEDHPNYEVSSCGRVRNRRTGRILKPIVNHGYERVNLDGRVYYVHKLVASTFFDVEDTHHQVNHVDGDIRNNNVSNLQWHERFESPCIVRCKFCRNRYKYDICRDQGDQFFCGHGEHI